MVKILVKKCTNDEGVFVIKDVERCIINSIRRILLSEIPSYTIDIIEMEKNNSLMNDEYLSHRIGLIPFAIRENEDKFRNNEDCFCVGGCDKCRLCFQLKKENRGEGLMNVYSSDFIQEQNVNYKAEPIVMKGYERGILICKLDKGESISLRGIIRRGTGKEHAKWSTVSTVSFREIPIVKIRENNFDEELLSNIVNSCPVGVFERNGGDLRIEDEMRCIQCNQCMEKSSLIDVNYDKNRFELVVESVGILDVKDLVKKSLNILKGKIISLKV